jgi:hypothetical protein
MCGVVLCIAAACTVLAEHHQVQCTCLFRAAYLCDLLTGNNSRFALSHHRRDTKRQYKTVLVVDDVCVWKRICRKELFFPSFEGRGCGFVFCVFFFFGSNWITLYCTQVDVWHSVYDPQGCGNWSRVSSWTKFPSNWFRFRKSLLSLQMKQRWTKNPQLLRLETAWNEHDPGLVMRASVWLQNDRVLFILLCGTTRGIFTHFDRIL